MDAEKYSTAGIMNMTSDNNYSRLEDRGIMKSNAKSYSVKASGQVLSLRNLGPIMFSLKGNGGHLKKYIQR